MVGQAEEEGGRRDEELGRRCAVLKGGVCSLVELIKEFLNKKEGREGELMRTVEKLKQLAEQLLRHEQTVGR